MHRAPWLAIAFSAVALACATRSAPPPSTATLAPGRYVLVSIDDKPLPWPSGQAAVKAGFRLMSDTLDVHASDTLVHHQRLRPRVREQVPCAILEQVRRAEAEDDSASGGSAGARGWTITAADTAAGRCDALREDRVVDTAVVARDGPPPYAVRYTLYDGRVRTERLQVVTADEIVLTDASRQRARYRRLRTP